MSRRRTRAGFGTDAAIMAFLGVTSLAVVVLLGQVWTVMRSHERMASATLDDLAQFAAERVAAELNTAFAAIFLDQISVGRSAHYAWLTGQENGVSVRGRWRPPNGAVVFHFSVDGDRLVARGGEADAELSAWVLKTVAAHAADVYPVPAPYIVLRDPPRMDRYAIVYRKEAAYERESVYGFVVDFDAFAPVYRRVLREVRHLPRSLGGDAELQSLMSVRLRFPQGDHVLFATEAVPSSEVVRAEAFAAKAGRMVVRTELDAERTRALMPGAYAGGGLPLFAALAALTLGLMVVAVALMRRALKLTRLRETFVANVSHDLRTPLAQIRMFTETLLLERLSDPEERRRSLNIIHRHSTGLARLVDNVLLASGRDYARVHPVDTELQDVLRESLEMIAPAVEAGSARVETEVEGDASAMIDPAALHRILMNLVDNAVKYGPRGQTVTVGLHNRGGTLVISVTDQGPGIPPRDRARVWDRFTRLDDRGRAPTGTGLGLAVVRDLAERHGGSVLIETAAGGGARVEVTLATDWTREEISP